MDDIGERVMEQRRRKIFFIMAMGQVLLLLLILLFCNIKYEVSDDFIMEMVASGIYTGQPDSHIMFSNIFMGWILTLFYNEKCAYCGAVLGWLPVESFEVDHFINEDSFPDTIEGRIEAGKISNLAWACVSCNRGKRGITIEPPYDSLLNVDNGNITHVFRRDEDFYIRICDTYQEDEFIQKFYHALHLGYETRRLDYFALKLEGKCNEEKDENRKLVLLEQLKCLRNRRNHMAVSSGA